MPRDGYKSLTIPTKTRDLLDQLRAKRQQNETRPELIHNLCQEHEETP